jgi:hypothetical protein
MEPLPRFFRMTDRPEAPLFNRLSGRPFNRVIKFDCFLLAWSQIQVPGDLPAILVDSGSGWYLLDALSRTRPVPTRGSSRMTVYRLIQFG